MKEGARQSWRDQPVGLKIPDVILLRADKVIE
jgi:hypothetical protein